MHGKSFLRVILSLLLVGVILLSASCVSSNNLDEKSSTEPYSSEEQIVASSSESLPDTKVTTTTITTVSPSNDLKYYSLSDDEKRAFELINNAMKNYSTSTSLNIKISPKVLQELFSLSKNVLCNSVNFPSEYAYTSNQDTGKITKIEFDFPYSKAEADSMSAQLKNKVSQIKAGIPKGLNEYEKAKYIHDYIINHCRYPDPDADGSYSDTTYFTAYGALVNGKAVCEGYSKAFYLLCKEVGIESLFVIGEADGIGHMWNMVKCDGKWYHIDLTWDDPVNDKNIDMLVDDYCLVTTNKILKNHKIDKSDIINYPLAS